jgi:hypothetical protein
MSTPRYLRPLLAVALLGVVVALAQWVSGLDTGLLLVSPALILLLPLLLGRYLGEEQLERLVALARAGRPARAVSVGLPRRRPRAAAAHGGRLLAFARAERAPPLTI